MKNLLTACLIALGFYAQAQDDIVVPMTQNTLINKVAADWCPPCGSWGWNFFDEVLDQNEDAVAFVLHHSGGLQNAAAVELTTNFGADYQPRFFLDGNQKSVNSWDYEAQIPIFEAHVHEQLTTSPMAQTGLSATYNEAGDQLTVTTKTAFFEDMEGEFFLGAYLIEKSYIGYQASIGDDANHRNILRTHLSDNIYGQSLASGSITANTEVSLEFVVDIANYDTDNLMVATVIWQLVDGKYLVVNTNKDTTLEMEMTTVATQDAANINGFAVAPTILADYSTISLDSKITMHANVVLLDINGKLVRTIYNGAIQSGHNSFIVTKNGLGSGQYFVAVQGKDIQISTPILVH